MKREMFENYDIPEEYRKMGNFGKLTWLKHKESMNDTKSYSFNTVLSMLSLNYNDVIKRMKRNKTSNGSTESITVFIKNENFNNELKEDIISFIERYRYYIDDRDGNLQKNEICIKPLYTTMG